GVGGAGEGGGIFSNNGAVDLTDSAVSGNRARGGAAAGDYGGFGGNGDGAGLATLVGPVTIRRSTLRANQAIGGTGSGTGGNGEGTGGGLFNFAFQLDVS